MAEELMLPFMPEEIVFNILQKLEADALSRFKCVSKQWCSLISQIQRKKLIFRSFPRKGEPFSFLSIDRATRKVEDLDIPWKSNDTWIYGSFNGLILVGLMNDLFLWNPYTGHSQKFFSYDGLSKSLSRKVGGLCFDSVNKEYKVVMSPNHDVVPRGSAIVGSSRNKTWKHIDFPYHDDSSLRSGPTLNNRIHWSVSKEDSSCFPMTSTAIIYFDADIDEFVDLPMPIRAEGEGEAIIGLGVLDGCLCMSRSKNTYEREVHILTMKEYGVGESWTTLFKIEGHLFTNTFVPFFYCDANKTEVLMKISEFDSHSIIIYDTSIKSRRDIATSDYSQCETVYEETLIGPTGYDWEELDAKGEAFYVEKFLSGRVRTVKRDKNGGWYVDKEEGCHIEKESGDKRTKKEKKSKKSSKKVAMIREKVVKKQVTERVKKVHMNIKVNKREMRGPKRWLGN